MPDSGEASSELFGRSAQRDAEVGRGAEKGAWHDRHAALVEETAHEVGRIGNAEVNIGLGRGSTDASDRWVFKAIVEFRFE